MEGHSTSGRCPAEYEVLRVEGLDEDPTLPTVIDSDDEIRVDNEISFNPRAAAITPASSRKRTRKAKRRLSAVLADVESVGDSSSSSSPTKMKRLRLILGKETVSTVNYLD